MFINLLHHSFQPFPVHKNGFKLGMKLEGVDPKHQSLFCVLTVAEICGYRIRLHFDGYSECYDFWTNADSPFLFPVGWCEENNRNLQPPKGKKCNLEPLFLSNENFCRISRKMLFSLNLYDLMMSFLRVYC